MDNSTRSSARRRRNPVAPASRASNVVGPVEPLEARTLFSAGTLDTSFGHGGVAYVAEQAPYDTPTLGGAVTPDGKTLLVGPDPAAVDASHYRVTRLNADGSVDASFGRGGSFLGAATVTINGQAVPTYRAELSIGADGGGRAYVLNDNGNVTRVTAAGALDTSYGDGGIAPLPDSFTARRLLVRPDGTLLVAGTNLPDRPLTQALAVCKLTADGRLDASFGEDGIAGVVFRYRGQLQECEADALAVDATGRIVAAGGGDSFLDVARFKADGSLDRSFAYGGALRLAPSYRPGHALATASGVDSDARFTAVAIRPGDGEIFAAASGETALIGGQLQGGAWTVAALRANGKPDAAFGDGGLVREHIGSRRHPSQAAATGIVVDAAGRPVVVASATGGAVSGVLIARLGDDGRADAAFAPGLRPASVDDAGVRLLRAANPSPEGGRGAFAVDVMPRGDGDGDEFEVTLQGTLAHSTGRQLTALLFNGGGSLDRSFGDLGVAHVAPMQTLDVGSLTPLPSPLAGRVFAVATASGAAFATSLLSGDGALDTSFGAPEGITDGTLRFDGGDVLAVQPDDKLLVEAPVDPDGYDTSLLRLNADGTPDATFGVGGRVAFTAGSDFTTIRFRRLVVRPDGTMVAVVIRHGGPLSYTYGPNSSELDLLDPSGRIVATQPLPVDTSLITRSIDTDLVVTPAGTVVVPYSFPTTFGAGAAFAGVLRFNADLTPDATVPSAPPPAGLPATFDVRGAAMPDGSVLFTAMLDPGPGGVAFKMKPDGSYDATFGTGGSLNVPGGGVPVAEPDGKFLIAAKSADGMAVVVRRFNTDGTADASFGDGGAFTLDLTALGGAAGNVTAQLSADGASLYVATTVTAARVPPDANGAVPHVGLLARLDL